MPDRLPTPRQVFDFQRAAAVAPGETVSLLFSIPPELAAVVDEGTGEIAFRGPVRHVIRIGGAAGGSGAPCGGMNVLDGSLTIAMTTEGGAAGRLVVQPAPPSRQS